MARRSDHDVERDRVERDKRIGAPFDSQHRPGRARSLRGVHHLERHGQARNVAVAPDHVVAFEDLAARALRDELEPVQLRQLELALVVLQTREELLQPPLGFG